MESNKLLDFYFWCCRKMGDIKILPKIIKWKIQRMNRGYSDCDVFGFDYYLSEIILGGLKQLRKRTCGFPGNLSNINEWYSILDEMIFAWEVNYNILDKDWLYTDSTKYNTANNIDMRKRWKKFGYAMTKTECKKYERGLVLFKEYFFSLWY